MTLGWLKWLARHGNDIITFVDESLCVDLPTNAWCIDSGAIVHVTNSLQGYRT
jgi:hypothetical protein